MPANTQPQTTTGEVKLTPLFLHLKTFLFWFLPPVLGASAFAATLRGVSFIRDDWYFIAHNPLLHGPAGVLEIWTTGYVQSIWGNAARVSEYRPVTMLSFYLDSILFGHSPGLMHATNILLHALNCCLLLKLLLRFIDQETAWIAAVIFAVMPIHTEAVAGLVNRTELFTLLWILAAWMLLDEEPTPRNLLLGTTAYALGLLSKEHAIFFPALLAMSDWVFHRLKPWSRSRWKIYSCLIACTGLYLWARERILAHSFQGGVPYFSNGSRIIQGLTVSRFWVLHYAWPAISGLGLCNDFSRPLLPDSGYRDLFAWLCLITLFAAVILSIRELLLRRSKPAFWTLLPFLFLLPTSHLLFPLDTLGAQRFLYLPSISIAAGLGWIFQSLRKSHPWIAGILCSLYIAGNLTESMERSRVWADDLTYYQDAVALNPVSPGPRFGYAMALLNRGDRAGAIREFHKAMGAAPSYFAPYYNLGKISWESGKFSEAQGFFEKAHKLMPDDASTLDFLGLLAEKKGRRAQAETFYLSALNTFSNDSVALYDLGNLYWREGRYRECRQQWNRFVELFPNDPESPRIRGLLSYQDVKNGKPSGIR